LSTPGSLWSLGKFSGWWTSRRRSETTFGFFSSAMSMMRPAPTLSRLPNSSISTRYGWPPIVTGMAFCGMLIVGQVRFEISGIVGEAARDWICEVSRMCSPEPVPAT
jgi:hypothetical protein